MPPPLIFGVYAPRYGGGPGGPVEHKFRIFGHTELDDRASAQRHLDQVVEAVLSEVAAGAA